METLERILGEHPFFKGLDPEFVKLACGCAKNIRFEPGEFICREGQPVDEFFLVRHGRVGLQLFAAGRGAMTFRPISDGEIFGLSWIVAPYRWTYDAMAIEPTRAIAMNSACLRGKCENDHHLGYEVMKRFMPVLIDRLHSTRLQLLDVYGAHD